MYRGHAQNPAFAPGSSKCQSGIFFFFFVSLYLLPIICPNFACRQLFLVPARFFAFPCWRSSVSQVQALQHCSEGPTALERGASISSACLAGRGPSPLGSQLCSASPGSAAFLPLKKLTCSARARDLFPCLCLSRLSLPLARSFFVQGPPPMSPAEGGVFAPPELREPQEASSPISPFYFPHDCCRKPKFILFICCLFSLQEGVVMDGGLVLSVVCPSQVGKSTVGIQ